MGEGKEKKDKKQKRESEGGADDESVKKIRLVSPIANPLADKKLTKKVLKFLILMQESMYMECLTLNGKKNIRNNYFSLSLGNNSTKLHGL